MTFNEAVQAMLDGKKVTRANPTGHGYIMLNDVGEVVDKDGDLYRLYKKDFIGNWEIYQPKATVGTLLSCDENQYRVVLNKSGKLDIANTKTWVVFIGNIYRYKLDDVIKSYSMKVIDGDSIV